MAARATAAITCVVGTGATVAVLVGIGPCVSTRSDTAAVPLVCVEVRWITRVDVGVSASPTCSVAVETTVRVDRGVRVASGVRVGRGVQVTVGGGVMVGVRVAVAVGQTSGVWVGVNVGRWVAVGVDPDGTVGSDAK